MTPLYTQPLRGNNIAKSAEPSLPASSTAAPRPAFYLTVAFVFVVYARFPEIMDMVTGSGLHSVRIIVLLALLAALLFGGAIRAVFSKVGICLLAFTAWLCVCTPFSVWRGGSFRTLRDFWALSLFSFVIIASSVQGLEQCRKIMYSFAAATIFIESFTLVMGRVQSGRLSLLGGTLGNANYLAMMLLMGVPFCLFVIRTKPGMSLFKLACAVMLFFVPATVATTGSRGGLVTLAVMFALYFIPLPASHKIVAAVGALILAVLSITWSTRSALDRYRTMFHSSDQALLSGSEQSAIESMELRKELLLSSVQLSMRHPLLGVGPGMFAVANADYTEETTGRANWNAWHETHNTFTQLSCEDGLPGLFLYCLTLVFCFKIVFTVEKRARQYPALSSVGHIAFALRLALIAFTGTSIFASNAYAYYFPMLAGLCVAVERASAEQFASLLPAGSERPVPAPRAAKAPAQFRSGRLWRGKDRPPSKHADRTRGQGAVCPVDRFGVPVLRRHRRSARDRHHGHAGGHRVYCSGSEPLYHRGEREQLSLTVGA
jgi:O-antigen ligase